MLQYIVHRINSRIFWTDRHSDKKHELQISIRYICFEHIREHKRNDDKIIKNQYATTASAQSLL